MKKRGRPPKPAEYWGDLGGLPLPGRPKKWTLNCGGRPTEFVVGVNLLDACRKFFAKYEALQWRDRRTNKLLYEIADAKTLRRRIMEAQRRRAGRQQLAGFKITHTGSTGILNGFFAGESVVVAVSDIQFTPCSTTTGLPLLRSTRLEKIERNLHRK